MQAAGEDSASFLRNAGIPPQPPISGPEGEGPAGPQASRPKPTQAHSFWHMQMGNGEHVDKSILHPPLLDAHAMDTTVRISNGRFNNSPEAEAANEDVQSNVRLIDFSSRSMTEIHRHESSAAESHPGSTAARSVAVAHNAENAINQRHLPPMFAQTPSLRNGDDPLAAQPSPFTTRAAAQHAVANDSNEGASHSPPSGVSAAAARAQRLPEPSAPPLDQEETNAGPQPGEALSDIGEDVPEPLPDESPSSAPAAQRLPEPSAPPLNREEANAGSQPGEALSEIGADVPEPLPDEHASPAAVAQGAERLLAPSAPPLSEMQAHAAHAGIFNPASFVAYVAPQPGGQRPEPGQGGNERAEGGAEHAQEASQDSHWSESDINIQQVRGEIAIAGSRLDVQDPAVAKQNAANVQNGIENNQVVALSVRNPHIALDPRNVDLHDRDIVLHDLRSNAFHGHANAISYLQANGSTLFKNPQQMQFVAYHAEAFGAFATQIALHIEALKRNEALRKKEDSTVDDKPRRATAQPQRSARKAEVSDKENLLPTLKNLEKLLSQFDKIEAQIAELNRAILRNREKEQDQIARDREERQLRKEIAREELKLEALKKDIKIFSEKIQEGIPPALMPLLKRAVKESEKVA